ncbi:MAG: DUF2059 domain-containing protein [Nostoc sp.]|uniref:DUF2059 domain-containing protein n=1 Tax=Nostoc sp. TaxID=1180 RepID=UPI002FF55D96
MKINFWFVAVVLSLTTTSNRSALAQIPTNTIAQNNNAQEIEITTNIKKLLDITFTKNTFKYLISELLNNFKSEYPQAPQKFWDTFAAELKPDDLVNEIIPLYKKYFTNEEIKQLIAFYETPVGQKAITTLPQIVQDSNLIGIKYGTAVAKRALKKLEAEGYIRPSK